MYLAPLFGAAALICQHKAGQCVNLPRYSVALPQMYFVLGGVVYVGLLSFSPLGLYLHNSF